MQAYKPFNKIHSSQSSTVCDEKMTN